MINLKWLKAAAIRAGRTLAQSAIAAIGYTGTISEVNWHYVIGVSTLAALLSFLTSIAGLPEVDKDEEG
jgi:hypothetical protein